MSARTVHYPEARVESKSCFLEAHRTGESAGKFRCEPVIAPGQCTARHSEQQPERNRVLGPDPSNNASWQASG